MKTDTSDVEIPGTRPTLTVNTIFELLLDQRRRYALYYLSKKVGAVPLEELAEQIALREGDPTYDRVERISTGLHHSHIPKLSDTGVARYDPERETIELLDSANELVPYLELSVTADR